MPSTLDVSRTPSRFGTAFAHGLLARMLLAHLGFLGTAKKEHGWHGRTTRFREELWNSPETKSLFSNLAELSMMRDLTQGGDHGRLFGESGTSDDAAVSIVG